MTPITAHAGHWLVNIAYLAPLIVLVAVVLWGRFTDRRKRGKTRTP